MDSEPIKAVSHQSARQIYVCKLLHARMKLLSSFTWIWRKPMTTSIGTGHSRWCRNMVLAPRFEDTCERYGTNKCFYRDNNRRPSGLYPGGHWLTCYIQPGRWCSHQGQRETMEELASASTQTTVCWRIKAQTTSKGILIWLLTCSKNGVKNKWN